MYNIATVVDQLKQLKLDHDTLNRRVEFLETKNKEQKEDIQFLLSIQLFKNKQNASSNKKHLYNQRGIFNSVMAMTSWKKRVKRPVRIFLDIFLR